MTIHPWTLVAMLMTLALGVGVLFGRYVVPRESNINRLGHEFESHLNDAFEARRGRIDAQRRIAARYGYTPPPAATTEGAIRAAVAVLELYNGQHDGYSGATLADGKGVRLAWTTDASYCLESGIGGAPKHKLGPVGDIEAGSCPPLQQ
jgi:hypothetical protein